MKKFNNSKNRKQWTLAESTLVTEGKYLYVMTDDGYKIYRDSTSAQFWALPPGGKAFMVTPRK